MATVLVLSSVDASQVLPALSLLSHRVRTIPAEPAALVNAPPSDVVVVDARGDLVQAKALCRILTTTGISAALILVVTEAAMPALNNEWGFDDVVLQAAGPGEVDARIRLVTTKTQRQPDDHMISASGVTIDEVSYQARVNGKALDLTFKEFELLRFLAGHPQRVFTREQLLSEVWGYDYFGGTRTVDVHVRRLRAKLGDMESLIGTVRNVGYRFTVADTSDEVKEKEQAEQDTKKSP
jgi:DNA-binding response OmpR family regulator